jgi:trehalose-phosphatase
VTSKGRKRLILLDYDGTLLPLQRRIDRSFLPPTTRGMLRRLARRHRVVFVTGREVRDLLRLAGRSRAWASSAPTVSRSTASPAFASRIKLGWVG